MVFDGQRKLAADDDAKRLLAAPKFITHFEPYVSAIRTA
jgi:hypothetical protein